MANSTSYWIVRIIVLCVLLATVRGNAAAQGKDNPLWRVGIGGGPVLVFSSASFRELSGISQPSAASAFSGTGSSVRIVPQVFLEYPFFSWGLLGVQAEYHIAPITLQATEQFPVFIDGSITNVVNTHQIAAVLTTVGVEPFLSIPLFSSFALRAGPRLDIVVSNSFEQSQEITSPNDIDFIGYEGRVITASGSIPEHAPLRFAVSLGASYTLPLNKANTWQLQPSVFYRQGLSNIASGKEWTTTSVGAAIAVVYAPVHPIRSFADTVFQRDTTVRLIRGAERERVVFVESKTSSSVATTPDAEITTVTIGEQYVREIPRPEALLTVGIDIRFVLDNGKETDTLSGAIKGVDRTLCVVPSATAFYSADSNENVLHGLFSREFSEEQRRSLGFRATDMQRRILAHIKRSADNAGQPVSLSARYSGVPKNTAERAVALVRDRCAEVWALPAAILPTDIRKKDGEASSGTTGVEVSVLPVVSTPLVVRDTLGMLPVQRILLRPSVVSEVGIRRWNMLVLRGSVVLQQFSGEGAVPPELTWEVQPEEFFGYYSREAVFCVLTVEDRDGHRDSARGSVVVHSSGAQHPATIDSQLLQVVVPENAATAALLHSIRETIRSSGFVPVRITQWRDLSSTPLSASGDIAAQLGVAQEHIVTRTVQRVSTNSTAEVYNNLIVITAEPLPRKKE